MIYSILNNSTSASKAATYSEKVWDWYRGNFFYQSKVLVGGSERYRIGNKSFYMDNIPYSKYSRYISNYENAINDCNNHATNVDIALFSAGVTGSLALKTGATKTIAGQVSVVITSVLGGSALFEWFAMIDDYNTASQNFNKLHAALGYSNK